MEKLVHLESGRLDVCFGLLAPPFDLAYAMNDSFDGNQCLDCSHTCAPVMYGVYEPFWRFSGALIKEGNS
jgi:hypothetical protein